ncbi:sugar ABC transporter substrate-binding protein [Microbacterium sp. PRC9]|uniref:ABC transporter substrate-binding protein n=1 Tax=Microbacterium sp. PRC9 TaxID=2962591 RepID=UPI002881D245|nr:sugar ABC transporter substrate-binding protein [Microbacterium sp. PRC9]MDT0143161.1 sugar ABC transporter substrate-binding protein [Microbacterium sp. PRC9]
MQRRKSIVVKTLGVVTAAALLLTGCAGGSTAAEDPGDVSGAFDWKRYEGETIRFVAGLQPWQAQIEPMIAEFEELTGIDVEMEALPEDQFRQRLQVELTAGSDAIDVFMSSIQQDGARFASSGWYEDLTPYIENKSLTSPDYDFADFSESVLEGHTFDGVLSALPIQLEVQMLFYRKDLLEAAGYDAPPATLDELEEIAEATSDPANNVYGWAARGKRAAAVTQLTSFILNHGAEYMVDGGAAFDSPEGVAAIKDYGRLIREYGPSGSTNNGWEELLALFQAGSLAQWADNSGQAAALRDPAQTPFADQVGYAPMPAGPESDAQTFFGWASAISSNSEHKGAAWLFLQWLTSPETVAALQATGIPGGRQSVEFGPDVPTEFVEAFQTALATAQPQLPQVQSVPEVRDVIGDAIVSSIQGDDVEAATATAAEQFNRIVELEAR